MIQMGQGLCGPAPLFSVGFLKDMAYVHGIYIKVTGRYVDVPSSLTRS